MKKKLSLFVVSVVGTLVLWNLYRFAYDQSFLWACILFICTFVTCFFIGLLMMKIINPQFLHGVSLLLKIVAIICAVPGICIILRYCGVRIQLMLSVRQSLFLAIIAGAIWGLQQSSCTSRKSK